LKVVILAGGLGSRISEESTVRPKPMIEIGGRPILWHIMKIYAAHGLTDFVICLGYKGYAIKEYFANYFLHMADVTFDLAENRMEVHQKASEPWRVTLVDTGDASQTGGRLKRVERYVSQAPFCFTYGDGVADIDIAKLVDFHRKGGRIATVTAVRPPGRFGALGIEGEDLQGVWGATALIEAIKTGRQVDPASVYSAVVIGGGNTAIDAARELKLLGVPEVRLVYRRGPESMSAYAHEREHATAEGVAFTWRAVPVAFEGNGRLTGVRLTSVDRSCNPVGEPFRVAADLVALAVGQSRLETLLAAIPGGIAHEKGHVVVDEATGRTSNPKYWAGGDLANGGAEVVNAAAEGKRAARGIHAWLAGNGGAR